MLPDNDSGPKQFLIKNIPDNDSGLKQNMLQNIPDGCVPEMETK